MATPARLAGVGVFVMGGLLLFTVGLFMIGDRQMAFAKKFIVYTEFKKITGLQPGAVVRVSGAKAGSVKKIYPPNKPSEKFRVKLEITQDLHQLVRTDSIGSIETEGLVGGSYLEISTGTDAAAPVSADGTIGGKEPFEIADLMQQMSDTVKKVNDTIDETKDDLARTIVSMAATVDNANKLLTDVSDDVKKMAKSGVKLSDDASEIIAGVRAGKGSLGMFVTDDEFYTRVNEVAKQAQEIVTSANKVVEQAKQTLEGYQAKDGPVQGMAADVKQTMDDARSAMAAFAENMEALKHNFLVRGFFKERGYFDLAAMSPAEYRKGALTRGGNRGMVRVWLRGDVLFERDPAHPEREQLTGEGKARLDSAVAPYLDHLASGVLMLEGYAQQGSRDEQYLRARVRASTVRDYLIGKFHLDPQATGAIPLGADSAGSPGKAPWDGIALAVILPTAMFEPRR